MLEDLVLGFLIVTTSIVGLAVCIEVMKWIGGS